VILQNTQAPICLLVNVKRYIPILRLQKIKYFPKNKHILKKKKKKKLREKFLLQINVAHIKKTRTPSRVKALFSAKSAKK